MSWGGSGRRRRYPPYRSAAIGVVVPTLDEFNALADRVTALEAGIQPIPPEPEPPPDGNQAKRICELVERFGVNTFSSLDEHNVWGSWPADYRPDTVIAALGWMLQDSGFSFGIREYHYAGRESWQTPWFQRIRTVFPTMRNIVCIGANGSANDVPSMLGMQRDELTGVVWVEGINEPNTDFGSGMLPYETTYAIQDAVWTDGIRGALFGPSIVAGMPHPEGWITGYCETQDNLDELNAAHDFGNGHYYPPASPDVPDTGYSVDEYVGGLKIAYAGAPISLTEFHPTLYNSHGCNPDKPGWSGARDAYYTLCTLFRCGMNGTHSLWWYALFDYGSVYKCGLYPTNQDNPRETAYGLRALCAICADRGDNRRGFAPGKLEYSVSGGDDCTTTDLYQGSDGTYYLAVWRSRDEMGGDVIPLTFDFPSKPGKIEEFDISGLAADRVTGGYPPTRVSTAGDGGFSSQLDGSVRVLRIVQ